MGMLAILVAIHHHQLSTFFFAINHMPVYNGSVFKRQQQTANINTQNAKLQKDNMLQQNHTASIKLFKAYTNSLQQPNTQQNTYQFSQQLVQLFLQRFQLAAATIIEIGEAQ